MPADKGGKVVLLGTDDYKRKALEILNNNEFYEKLTSNPLESKNSYVRSKLNRLAKSCADRTIFQKTATTNLSLSYFYGLSKLHKPGCPLCPIISNVGTVTRPLAGWLAQQLSPYLGKFSDLHLVNSLDYKERLQSFVRQHSTNCVKMVNLYIVSLLFNVPVEGVLTFIDAQIQNAGIGVSVQRE